jgi:hypothetical protein
MRGATDVDLGEDFVRMFQWLDTGGPDFDIANLRDERPRLLTLERFLRTSGRESAVSADAELIE